LVCFAWGWIERELWVFGVGYGLQPGDGCAVVSVFELILWLTVWRTVWVACGWKGCGLAGRAGMRFWAADDQSLGLCRVGGGSCFQRASGIGR